MCALYVCVYVYMYVCVRVCVRVCINLVIRFGWEQGEGALDAASGICTTRTHRLKQQLRTGARVVSTCFGCASPTTCCALNLFTLHMHDSLAARRFPGWAAAQEDRVEGDWLGLYVRGLSSAQTCVSRKKNLL